MNVRRVKYQYTVEYEIECSPNIFEPSNPSLLSVGKIDRSRRFVVVDNNVEKYYAEAIRNYFRQNHVKTRIIAFTSGEEHKTLERYLSILRELDAFPICRRDEPIIAIGGGVLTDVVGFVASCYRRGIPHIKVPTTLMGFVDASIGVKAGINFNGSKNRLGGFVPPVKVLLDRAFLKTLPRRHLLNGVCEIIKLAIIKDAVLFNMLESKAAQCVEAKFQDDPAGAIIDQAISGMLEELQDNLFEGELARKVDFGHTFSYGLETRYEAGLFHGEAVLLDVVISCLIARRRGLLSDEEVERIFHLVASLGLTLDTSYLEPDLLWQSLQERIYHRNGQQRVPLPDGIGGCIFFNDIGLDEIEQAVRELDNKVMIKSGIAW
jgi:3-dehydroquinate synthetase